MTDKSKALGAGRSAGKTATGHLERRAAVKAILGDTSGDDILFITGLAGSKNDVLEAVGPDCKRIYPLFGAMGAAAGMALGLALAQPNRRMVVVDGDGAALMRLGAQSIVGFEQPANLVHVLLDNAVHESTGGQATVSRSVNFCAIAAASGYREVSSVADPAAVAAAIASSTGPAFIHAPTLPGVPAGLPRPATTPAAVARRLREFLQT